MDVNLLVQGGNMKPGPSLSQQLGPTGINIKDVISKVNESTSDYKGLKVPVLLKIDTGTKEFEVEVFSPPVSELLKKEVGIEKGSGAQKKEKVGDVSIEQVIKVSKDKMPYLLANDLKSAVKGVVGTAGSLGLLVENKSHSEVQEEIDQGKYDKAIKEERTEMSEEKKEEMEEYFEKIEEEQEKKAEEEAKEAEAAESQEGTAEAGKEGEEKAEGEEKKEEKTEEKK